ncbi:MAG: hypothetical protein J2P37_28710 [Ktedonobacteraceae bacterium]|nr:hypothetical protein [Ktedonobacteraceae bacterium]
MMRNNPIHVASVGQAHDKHLPILVADAKDLYTVVIRAQLRLADMVHHATPWDEEVSEADRASARRALPVAYSLCWRVRAADEQEAEINQRLARAHHSYQQGQEEKESQKEKYDNLLIDLAEIYGWGASALLRLVATWEQMGNEVEAMPSINRAAQQEGAAYSITHLCLERRVQVARYALDAMEHLLCVERERHALRTASSQDNVRQPEREEEPGR